VYTPVRTNRSELIKMRPITITVRDRRSGRSKCMTIDAPSLAAVFADIKRDQNVYKRRTISVDRVRISPPARKARGTN